jgi:DNA-binding winged helix-turn-helix (wHTH) protein
LAATNAELFVEPRILRLASRHLPANDYVKVREIMVRASGSTFGPFRLLPTQFLLLEGDKQVPLGSRALEILIALLERRGELVSKQDLMAQVWPNAFAESANLTVHMSALRRALRDGEDGNRFIINIPGRGYCFIA